MDINILRNLKLKYKIVIPLLLFMLMLFAVIAIVTVNSLNRTLNFNNERLIETKVNEINKTIENVSNKALYIASISSEMKVVQDAYNKYYKEGNLIEASYILENQFKKINKKIFESSGYEPRIHFHLPPAISFCRCWSNVRGDDISSFRNSVLKVSRDHSFVKGIETGRGGFVIRGIAPIFSETGKYYGSVEAFFNINHLVKEIDRNTNEDFAVFMKTDLLKIATNFLEDTSTNIQIGKQAIDNYILVEKTDKFIIENIIDNKLDSNILKNNTFEYDNYKYAIITIKNITGVNEGIGILQIDISDYKTWIRKIIIFELILFLFLIIIVVVLLSKLGNVYIIKKIKDTDLFLQKLAGGELLKEITVSHEDEIGSMQNSLNKLNENITKNLNFAIEIGKGNLNSEYKAISESDILGNALSEMQRKLILYSGKTKKALEKSMQSETKYQQLSDLAFEGIIIHDKGIAVDMNLSLAKMFGYKREDLFGKNVMKSLFKEKYHQIISENILKNYALPYEAEGIKKDGSIFPVELESRYFKYSDSKKTFRVAAIRDISKRKDAEEKIIKAKEKAEESDRLKTEFLNNMSHEIRTPMNGILGFSDLLDKQDLTDNKRKQYIKIIQNSGHQLMRIIDDILEISKLGTKQVKSYNKEVCLNDILLELFSIFDIKAKENKTPLYLKKGVSDKESIILTDETKLNKILSNLLENALKFTNVGFIEFGYTILKTEHVILLQLYVKDTGIGIRPEKQEIIFERFSQEEKSLSENVGGLGLGLSIAKENAELIGGKITLESEKGKGSTFYVTMPYKPVIAIADNNNSHSIIQSQHIPEKDEFTILIVEDEEVNFLYLDTLIEEFGEEVKTIHAKQGEEAVKICKDNSKINLILMDLKMPIMNGYEATKLIKEFRPDLPVIAQTAYTTIEDKDKAISAGCDDFISKPISEEILREIISKYLS